VGKDIEPCTPQPVAAYLKRSMREPRKLRKLLCRLMWLSSSSLMLPKTYRVGGGKGSGNPSPAPDQKVSRATRGNEAPNPGNILPTTHCQGHDRTRRTFAKCLKLEKCAIITVKYLFHFS